MNKQNDNSFDPDSYFRNVEPTQEFDFQNTSQISDEMLTVIAELERRRLTGIGGWLLFYVVLSVLSGLLTLVNMDEPLDGASFCFNIAVIGTTIAGLILTFQRKRLAIQVNILCETLCIVSNLWSINYIEYLAWKMVIQDLAFGNGAGNIRGWMLLFGGMIAVSVIINILWIIYFFSSRRVKYTLVR